MVGLRKLKRHSTNFRCAGILSNRTGRKILVVPPALRNHWSAPFKCYIASFTLYACLLLHLNTFFFHPMKNPMNSLSWQHTVITTVMMMWIVMATQGGWLGECGTRVIEIGRGRLSTEVPGRGFGSVSGIPTLRYRTFWDAPGSGLILTLIQF